MGIDGVENDNFPEIYRAMGMKNKLTAEFKEAVEEMSYVSAS